LDWSLVGPQNRSGRGSEEKKPSLVTLLTHLSLLYFPTHRVMLWYKENFLT